MSDTILHDHQATYNGPPHHTFITLETKTTTVVVDFAHNGVLHYYELSRMTTKQQVLFEALLGGYYDGNHHLTTPLSVYISKNNLAHLCTFAYGMVDIKHISRIEGPCPYHWFAGIKARWRRKDLVTGQITGSKPRRPLHIIEAEKAARAARKAARLALLEPSSPSTSK